jgi:hypothetical protein
MLFSLLTAATIAGWLLWKWSQGESQPVKREPFQTDRCVKSHPESYDCGYFQCFMFGANGICQMQIWMPQTCWREVCDRTAPYLCDGNWLWPKNCRPVIPTP